MNHSWGRSYIFFYHSKALQDTLYKIETKYRTKLCWNINNLMKKLALFDFEFTEWKLTS
jgi:hypothetical protein